MSAKQEARANENQKIDSKFVRWEPLTRLCVLPNPNSHFSSINPLSLVLDRSFPSKKPFLASSPLQLLEVRLLLGIPVRLVANATTGAHHPRTQAHTDIHVPATDLLELQLLLTG